MIVLKKGCSLSDLRVMYMIPLLFVMASPLVAETKKSTPENYLADSAAHLGTDYLVKDRSDPKGVQLIAAALKLNSDNDRALLTSMILKKEIELTSDKHRFTAEDFAQKAILRGTYLYDKKRTAYTGSLPLAKLYFTLAELFKPTDKTVLIYLARLEKDGETQSLDELLATDSTAADWLDAKQEVEKAVEDKKPVHFWGVGMPMAELTKLYGAASRTKYAPRSNGTLKYFNTSSGQVEAFIAGGKCVRIQYQLPLREYPGTAEQDAYVLTGRTGWTVVLEKPGIRGYESTGRTMAASMTVSGSKLSFVAWSKTFYK